MVAPLRIVIDTNVVYSAMLSQQGASYKLLMVLGDGFFTSYLSVPLMLEYEDVIKRNQKKVAMSMLAIDDILDYIALIAHQQDIHYLWRPFLNDPKDDMVLELAVAARCSHIITFNLKDFRSVEDQFGIAPIEPKLFLEQIGVIR